MINPESKFSLGRRFEFYDFLNCDNSVKVYEIDPEIFPCIFTYHLISKLKYDDEVYEEYGIWNGSIWGSNNRIIPVGESRDYTWCTYHISNTCGEDNIEDNIYKKAEELMTEIKEEQQEAAKYD